MPGFGQPSLALADSSLCDGFRQWASLSCHPEVLRGVRLDSSEYLGMTSGVRGKLYHYPILPEPASSQEV
jgi:hypothetical protein